jgi:hypothetical protein
MRRRHKLSLRKKRAGAFFQDWQTQPVMASKRMIDLACDNFFRSRGIPTKDSINGWTRRGQTDPHRALDCRADRLNNKKSQEPGVLPETNISLRDTRNFVYSVSAPEATFPSIDSGARVPGPGPAVLRNGWLRLRSGRY